MTINKRNNILVDTICHSDDRREEDVLLSIAKNLENTKENTHVDVPEILRRSAPLGDKNEGHSNENTTENNKNNL